MKYLLQIIVLAALGTGINAQVRLSSYLDVGENNVSDGIFINNAYRSNYQTRDYLFEAGVLLNYAGNNPTMLSGFDLIASKEMVLKEFPFLLNGFFMVNRFSEFMHETNVGIRLDTRKAEHFLFELGMNFKTYSINLTGRETYIIDKSNSRLGEYFNLLYTITGYLKPHDSDWNMGISLTNADYYVINQATNPVFNLQLRYRVKSNLLLYMEGWYKQAGIMNINANYFGYFLRGGLNFTLP